MADIRIKDLATLESASLTGDVFVIDGTTGTRKLNAFSPTFGGNATVTGTLTGNSTITGANLISSVNSGAANGSEFTAFSALVGTDASLGPCRVNIGALPSATFSSRYGYIACYDSGDYRKLYLGGSPGIAATGGQILIPATIASTTTSTGALVVGNGSSGGLGVGGSINAGGNVTISGSNGYAVIGGRQWSFRANSSGGSPASGCVIRDDSAAADRLTIDINGNTSVLSSTASNSTSSGALVVSGGVGIAKQIVAGGVISIDPLDASPEDLAPEVAFCRGVSLATTASVLAFGSGARIGLLRGYQDGGNLVEWRFGSYIGTTFNEQMRLGGTSATSSSLTIYGTTASTSTSSGALVVSGGVGVAGKVTSTALGVANTSQSIPAWGDVGAQLSIAGAVITDTTSSGTVSRFVSNSISASSIAASSPTTYTQAASLFIAAGPTANTNVTITNSYALFIAGGRINFGGLPTSSAGLQAGTLWNDGGTLKVA